MLLGRGCSNFNFMCSCASRNVGKNMDAVNKACCIYVFTASERHLRASFQCLHDNKEKRKKIPSCFCV